MRRLDDYPIDPEIAAQLDAIDATLAGDPVDPQHAELAELALLLAAERPGIDQEFAASLDARVGRRFAPVPAAAPAPRRRWLWKPVAGTLAAGLAAVAVVVGLGSIGGGSSSSFSSSSASSAAATTTASASASAASSSGAGAPATPGTSPAVAASTGAKAPAVSQAAQNPKPGGSLESAQPFGTTTGAGGTSTTSAPAPQPPSNGRRIVQSAQLALTTAPARIDDVAQEAFDVIGRESGIVDRSTVTATGGPDGYAEFQLRVPSSALSDTMNALSSLQYAHVSSRTDATRDVNDAYISLGHQLADARALRTALLKQLANAVTQQQITSLTAQIHDAEASIASDQASLNSLNRQIAYSQITLTINANFTPTPTPHSSGFTIGKAAHDAGRVLTVAAGVALIALAALVPVTLIGALALWIAAAFRRRRREQALDAA